MDNVRVMFVHSIDSIEPKLMVSEITNVTKLGCTYSIGGLIFIVLNPILIVDSNDLLEVLLHEVIHAKRYINNYFYSSILILMLYSFDV